MSTGRFTDAPFATPTEAPSPNGFLLFAVPVASAAPPTTIEWFYQRVYEEAVKANQQAPMRDLFKVMN
jgi:hypothetical protein